MGVFLYDLIRATRRGRLALLRTAYALALLAALGGVYVNWFPGRLTAAGPFAPGPALRFGGVVPWLLFTCFGLMASSLVSLSGLSLFCSARARTVTGAVTATYGIAAAFYIVTALVVCAQVVNPFVLTAVVVLFPPD